MKTYPVTAYLNDFQYGDLAEYAVKNGIMFDSALLDVIKAGLAVLTKKEEVAA